ncbi:MAG: sporulation protein YqfD [Clostridia bacterium]|nr:sporulation protein YqfD [Clostridia bacterium]
MIRIYQFFRGYLQVEAEGNHLEKLLNLALVNGIYLWDVKRLSKEKISFFVSNRGYRMMEEYAKKTQSSISVRSRKGAEVLWKSTKRRSVFLASFFIFIGLVLTLSSFIWTVEIEGGEFIDQKQITQKLASYGLGVGRIRKNFDLSKISNQLIQDFDEILWANAEISGTRLLITLVPRTKAPELIPKDVPTNIVAKKDGIIKEITAENGDAMVRIGDTVVKDQILISGLIPSPTVGSRYLHSIGAIRAVTWEERSMEQKLYRYDKVNTGRKSVHREVSLPFLKIPLDFRQTIDFYNYDSIIKEKTFLFLTYRETSYVEYTLEKHSITVEEAVKTATDMLLEQMSDTEAENVISKKASFEVLDEETLFVTLLLECEEELGVPKEIIKQSDIQ